MRWYKTRDEIKIKTDGARNGYETMIYKFREWLREDENAPYIKEDDKDALIESLTESEDWLYEDGANQNHTTYESMEKNLTLKMKVFVSRQHEHEMRDKVNSIVE